MVLDLHDYLKRCGRFVDQGLRRLLPPVVAKPKMLHQAMRYSIFAGGKRLRPALCFAAAQTCRGSWEAALPLACAVECVHTYSLIHDDLPAMDDDDLRRGKPTNHKVYGEGLAILAGDALLTHAFELTAGCEGWPRYGHQTIVREIAQAAGSRQLIAGQAADLASEGKSLSRAGLQYIHERKTSALLRCAVRLGGMSANCLPKELAALTDFGSRVGLAFQIVDDVLDVTQSTKQLGKTAGKDAAKKKATYPSVVGLKKSRKIARQLTDQAFRALKVFPKRNAAALYALAQHLLERDR